jgi:phosphatidylserine synthase
MSVDSDIILEYQLNSGNKNREVMDKFEGVGAYELVCVYASWTWPPLPQFFFIIIILIILFLIIKLIKNQNFKNTNSNVSLSVVLYKHVSLTSAFVQRRHLASFSFFIYFRVATWSWRHWKKRHSHWYLSVFLRKK